MAKIVKRHDWLNLRDSTALRLLAQLMLRPVVEEFGPEYRDRELTVERAFEYADLFLAARKPPKALRTRRDGTAIATSPQVPSL